MRAVKALGQNFLINTSTITKIVDVASSTDTNTIIEIGPGTGALTIPLSDLFETITCVEKDALLHSQLEQTLEQNGIRNVKTVNSDILNYDYNKDNIDAFDVIGSLPFNISKRIILQFLAHSNKYPSLLHVVIQKEVADSYCATPPRATFLSNMAQIYGTVTRHFNIPRSHFRPTPTVDATFITFTRTPPRDDHKKFASFVKALFRNPRKTLLNNIKPLVSDKDLSSLKKEFSEKDLTKRPAELTFDEFENLYIVYNKCCNNGN